MDATTPPRGDEPTGAQPADPPPLIEPAQRPRAAGSSPVGAAPGNAPAQPDVVPARDNGPEDPTVPDTAVEATPAGESAGSRPAEPGAPAPADARVDGADAQPAPEPAAVSSEPTTPEPGTPASQPVAPSQAPESASDADRSGPDSGATAAEPPRSVPSAAPAAPGETGAPAQSVVYVAAPTPPKKKGNRGMGVLLAALSTILFFAVYVGVVVLINFVQGRGGGLDFLGVLGLSFYIPVVLFAIGFILLTAIVNRAGWWAFVLGSLFVGAFVYLGTIGLLLLSEASRLTPDAAVTQFRGLLISPIVVAAGLIAREVSLWVGAAISARGRRIKARNAEARAEFDREQAEHQAEIERTGAVVRPA